MSILTDEYIRLKTKTTQLLEEAITCRREMRGDVERDRVRLKRLSLLDRDVDRERDRRNRRRRLSAGEMERDRDRRRRRRLPFKGDRERVRERRETVLAGRSQRDCLFGDLKPFKLPSFAEK